MVLFYSQLCRPCMMMDALVQMVHRDYEPAVIFIEVLSDSLPTTHWFGAWESAASRLRFFITPSGDSKSIVGLMKQQDLRPNSPSWPPRGRLRRRPLLALLRHDPRPISHFDQVVRCRHSPKRNYQSIANVGSSRLGRRSVPLFGVSVQDQALRRNYEPIQSLGIKFAAAA